VPGVVGFRTLTFNGSGQLITPALTDPPSAIAITGLQTVRRIMAINWNFYDSRVRRRSRSSARLRQIWRPTRMVTAPGQLTGTSIGATARSAPRIRTDHRWCGANCAGVGAGIRILCRISATTPSALLSNSGADYWDIVDRVARTDLGGALESSDGLILRRNSRIC